MLSSRTLSVALTFASTLSFGVNALPHWTRELSVSSIAGDIGCPVRLVSLPLPLFSWLRVYLGCQAGQSILTIVNKATIPDTSPGEVWSYIGDFCNVAWEGFDLIVCPFSLKRISVDRSSVFLVYARSMQYSWPDAHVLHFGPHTQRETHSRHWLFLPS